jgi:hypothetical protein
MLILENPRWCLGFWLLVYRETQDWALADVDDVEAFLVTVILRLWRSCPGEQRAMLAGPSAPTRG